MGRFVFIGFILFLFILLDWYTFHGMAGLFTNGRHQRLFRVAYLGLSISTYVFLVAVMYLFYTGQMVHRTEMANFMNGFVFAVFVSKLLFCSILVLQDGVRALLGGYQYMQSYILDSPEKEVFMPERRKFVTTAGTFVAALPFFTMLYGITRGKYQYTVEKVVIESPDLPEAFDGFTVVQISDIHAGSFDNKEKVMAGVQKINALNPDLVCFTGDLVNAEKEEILPYIDVFGAIKAKYGKYAVLGNHDYYGSYDRNNPEATKAYYEEYFQSYKKMGFELMNNTHTTLTLEGQNIHLVGVENWGAGNWFPKKGDLDLATAGIPSGDFSILMSHDPTHWEQKVLSNNHPVQLTLSGHTHGFQFGFQMPGFKWSPAQYRYKQWSGLYNQDNKYLYVNRGFGFLGFPGRVGMWPEITLIELKKGKRTDATL